MDEYSIKWRSNIVAVITGDTLNEGNLKRQIKNLNILSSNVSKKT